MTFPVSFSYPWYLLLLLFLLPVLWLWWMGTAPMRRHASLHRRRAVASLILRVSILVLVVFAIAGLQWVQASDELAVVFVLDVSDSIDATAREEAVAFIRAALAEMKPGDQAALVLFGADAWVERPLSPVVELGLDSLASMPATTHTDIGEALRLGAALLPATAQRRLVLLSDGQENVPGGEMAATLAATSGVELDVVPLPAPVGDEAWLDAIDAPATLYENEEFSVVVRVRSTVEQRALLRLFAEQTPSPPSPPLSLAAEEALLLRQGLNSFFFDLSAGGPGFSTFTAQLIPEKDLFYQNNVLGAFALVYGPPKVLVVARSEYIDEGTGQKVDDAANLVLALERAGLIVERMTPAYMPADLASLGEYASLVLVNVPAPEVSSRQMALLQATVRDLGRGLVCVGGEESYGVGGYFRTPLEETLPVKMTIADRERMPPLALLFVIDKSGSMGIAAGQGTVRKIDLAKEAILRSLELLHPGDQVGVVAFENTAQWVSHLSDLHDAAAVQEQVMTLQAGGGTDISAGLGAAVTEMGQSDAQLKHVILLTDGGASQEGLHDLAIRLRASEGTLSVVGVGQDAAPFLQPLALAGGGRYHFTDDPATIPQIFVQETTLAQRAYIVEEPFYPVLAGRSSILEGIEAVPALYGYVATSVKPAAQMILASGLDDPVLAQWQYGLGRAVAWTSDAKGRWAREWVRWEQYPRFWAQVVRWTIAQRDESGLEARVVDEGEQTRVTVDVVGAGDGGEGGEGGNDLAVQVRLFSPSHVQKTITLQQTASGRYEGDLVLGDRLRPAEQGVYLMHIAAVSQDAKMPPDADPSQLATLREEPSGEPLTQLTGFVRPYSSEYRSFGTDEVTLHRLAEAGRGEVITDPTRVFMHDLDAVRTYTDVWPWLLGAAICLLPLDVGIRRVTVEPADVRRAIARLRREGRGRRGGRTRLRRRSWQKQPSVRMSRLMAAKKRAPVQHHGDEASSSVTGMPGVSPISNSSGRGSIPTRVPASSKPQPVSETASPEPLPTGSGRYGAGAGPVIPPSPEPRLEEAEQSGGQGSTSMTARLLAAKKRAQQDGVKPPEE
jgi:Mg-chelatase subunit ChlD